MASKSVNIRTSSLTPNYLLRCKDKLGVRRSSGYF